MSCSILNFTLLHYTLMLSINIHLSIQFCFLLQEYGDDKVQLAIQTYELVDKHIRRLDNDLARFESEIQDKALNARNQDEPVGKSKLYDKFFVNSINSSFRR